MRNRKILRLSRRKILADMVITLCGNGLISTPQMENLLNFLQTEKHQIPGGWGWYYIHIPRPHAKK